MLEYHGGDTTSNGVNANEQVLTPSSVVASNFGKLFSVNITDTPNNTGIPTSELPSGYDYTDPDGQVYAEPVVKTGVTITTGANQGLHDVVFVATSMDSLFAIDANTGTVLWKDSFIYNSAGNPNPLNANIASGITAVPGGSGTEILTADINPFVGIVGTPVIDGVNGYIYFVAKTREARGTSGETKPDYVLTLHKVSLANGLDNTFVPSGSTNAVAGTVIADTTLTGSNSYTFVSGPYVVAGQSAAAGATTVSGQNRIYLNAIRQMTRPALLLYGGRVYISSASHGDNGPYHGWVLTYDAGSLTLNGVWNATPYGSDGEGGIWQGGGGLVIDPANGNIFFETGNGDFDGNNTNGVLTGLDTNGFPINGDYGDCFVKLVLDSTTSQGNQGTNKNGWGLAVADYFAPINNQALSNGDHDLGSGGPTLLPNSAGSTAHPHLLLGGGKEGELYLIDRDNMGKFGATTDNIVQEETGVLSGLLSVCAYFNGLLYVCPGYGGNMVSWPLSNAVLNTSSIQQTPDSLGFPGSSPFITANGTTNGIVWVLDKNSGELRGYDASNLSSELYTTNQNAARDALDTVVKFSCATPVNGHVYVATNGYLYAYGLASSSTSPPAAPSGLSGGATTPTSVLLNWTDNSNNEAGFSILRSSNGVNFSQVGTVGVNVTSYVDSGVSSQATYYYEVEAFNDYNTLSYSAASNVIIVNTPATGSVVPAYLYHFDEGTGTSTTDSASGNNGTLIGSPLPTWVVPGRIGNANLSFSGNGQVDQTGESAVQVKNDLSPILGTTSSLLFWIKTTQTGNNTHYDAPAVTGSEEESAGNDINWGTLNATGHIGISVGDSGSVLSANPVNDGNWHQIAITRNASSGVCDVYVDGALSNSAILGTGAKTTAFTLIGAVSVVASDDVTFLGGNFISAQLDDVEIFAQVVTASFVASVAQAPAAPTNLTVTPASGTELDLSWTNNATNATANQVWSSTNGGAFSLVTTLAATATSYMDTGLLQATNYAFYIVAVNSGYSSPSSTVSSATPVPPATPTNATCTLLAPMEVDLAWTDNATNETGYEILRRTGTGDYSPMAQLPAGTSTYKDMTVSPSTTYDYHIEAYNVAGYSDFAGISVTTPSATTFTSYMSSYGITNPTLAAPTADPDNIGIPNLIAYAFNLNPTVSSSVGLPLITQENGALTISFAERIPPTDVTYTVEVSGDMMTWNSGGTYTTLISTTAINNVMQMVVVSDNTPLNAGTKRFIRVTVVH